MKFTFAQYEIFLDLLKSKNYAFSGYSQYPQSEKCVILRHDIDFSLRKALELARIENAKDVRATYFVLLSTNFYNVFSRGSYEMLMEVMDLGHSIGLHFDEKRYDIVDSKSLNLYINNEKHILEELLGESITAVSMHRPSKWILESNVKLEGIINTYSDCFFKDFKYLSDSRMLWREDVLGIIEKDQHDRLHILTHPFWYSDNEETMEEKLVGFIDSSRPERYAQIKENFRNLEEIISFSKIIY